MLHDAVIHFGLTSAVDLGERFAKDPRVIREGEERKNQNARLEKCSQKERRLSGMGRRHAIPGCGTEVPPNILPEDEYLITCWASRCGGDMFMDMRLMDLGIEGDKRLYAKIMKRFEEYVMSGACQVCQYDSEQKAQAQAEKDKANQEDEENYGLFSP